MRISAVSIVYLCFLSVFELVIFQIVWKRGLENGKSDTSVSPAGLALFSSEGMEAPGGDVVSRMGVADGVNSSHLGVSNEDFYSRRSKNMNIIDKPVREIKEIRVFFSDGTYEAFVPSGK